MTRVAVPPDVRRRVGDLVARVGKGGAIAALGTSPNVLDDVVASGGSLRPDTLERISAALDRVESN